MLVKLGQRGTLTLPKELREGMGADTLLDAVRRDDGVIELRPRETIDASQSWFWTERWQNMEREADDDVRNSRVRAFQSAEELIAHLEGLTSEEHPDKSLPADE